MKANMYKPSEKNKIHRVDSDEHWTTSIKSQFSGFLFLPLCNILQKTKNNNGLISSLLKMFAMFEIRLSYGDEELDVLSIKCINCKIETA